MENGFISEINAQNIKIIKLPGKRVERKDDYPIEMYNHAFEKINNLKTPSIKKQTIEENSDWNQDEPVKTQSKLNQ